MCTDERHVCEDSINSSARPSWMAELRSVTGRLASLALVESDPKKAEAVRAQVLELTQKREELEVRLSRQSTAFPAEFDSARSTSTQAERWHRWSRGAASRRRS